LSVQANAGIVEFSIKDNGKGFDGKSVKRGNGLENMQKRADEMGAKLVISSRENEGTSLVLYCKIT
jgi:signal transduction histidine kinase